MFGGRRILSGVLLLVAAGVTWVMGDQVLAASDPSVCLYDVPERSAGRLSEEELAKKGGWSRLAEDDTAHRFAGRAVLLNDKIVAVLEKGTANLEVYSRQEPGWGRCARLQPICEGRADLPQRAVAIKENSPSCVALEVGFSSPGGALRRITYELNVGGAFIKTAGGSGVEKLRVHAPCRFAVLPDFFGDDILIDAAAIPVSRADLPSENFLLHMMHGGSTILMTVSESRDNDIGITLSAGPPREIVGSDIAYGKQPQIWIAILRGRGIWHEHQVALADADKVLKLDWRMPFTALWRVDWRTADKLTDSWEMLLQHPEGKYVMQGWFGQDESEGQRFGEEFGNRDWNRPGRKRWNPVLGSFAFPCWVDHDGQAYLQPLKQRRYTSGGEVCNFVGPVVIYPLDRLKNPPFITPIENLTVVDLVRMTLGVGPCQYILDLEGQKRNSPGVATCYARDVINAIYKKGTQLQNGPVIDEHLAAAVAFIRNVRERIDQYVEFGQQMTAWLQEQKRRHPQHAEFLDEMLLVTRRLEQYFEENREQIHTPDYAQAAAERFRQTLRDYTGADAFERCDKQMRIFTSIGGAQDGLVASCRMIVKTLRQRAGIAMALNPELKDIATSIRARTHAMLRNPTAYEAPRH